MAFGDNLRRLRKLRGLDQHELGDILNVSQATIASWENGLRNPTIDTIKAIARFFGVSTDALLDMPDGEISEEEALWMFREESRRDPERRRLFKLAKYASLKDVKQADALISALAATNPDFYDGDDPA